MNIRIISLLFLAQSFFFIEAMDLVRSREKDVAPIADFLELLRNNKQSKLAIFLEQNPTAHEIAAFLRASLGSDEETLRALTFFELKEAVSQDGAINSEDFRKLFHQLHSKEKAIGIFVLPRISANARKSNLAPVGLENLGSTCFLNASVQALLPAAHDIDRALKEAAVVNNETRSLLVSLFNHMESSTCLAAFEKHAQAEILQQNKRGHQCNIEFMDKLFDWLTAYAKKTELPPELADMFSLDFLAVNDDSAVKPLTDLFAVEETKALINNGDSLEAAAFKQENPEAALHLSIKKGSLNDLLNDHFGLEQFAPAEKPRNDKTGGLFDAQQKKLTKTGEYLCLHIKRVDGYDAVAKTARHSTEPTPFPLSHLDLRNHFLDANKSPGQYDLESIVMHHGTANSGHYITYSRRANLEGKETWYVLNDESARAVSDENMMRIALSGNDGYYLPTTFIYRLSPKLSRSGSNSEDESSSPRHTRFILCTVASNKGGGVEIQEKVFLEDRPDKEIDVSTDEQRKILINILKSAPLTFPGPAQNSSSFSSSFTKSSSTGSTQYVWSDPKNILIPIALILIAAIYGKEVTPTEKAEREKEEEKKKRDELHIRLPKLTPAVTLDPHE